MAVQERTMFTSIWEGIDSLYNEPTTWLVISIASCALGVVTKVYEFAIVAISAIIRGASLWNDQETTKQTIEKWRSNIQTLDQILDQAPDPDEITPETDFNAFVRLAKEQTNLAIKNSDASAATLKHQIDYLERYMQRVNEVQNGNLLFLEKMNRLKAEQCRKFLTRFIEELTTARDTYQECLRKIMET